MARFARENPACRCTLLCGDSAAVQQMLLNGDIHLGFVGSADDRQDLIYEPIAEDRLVLITPNTPRFAALKTQGVLGRELVPRAVPLPRTRERHAEGHRQLSQRDPP